MKEVEKTRFWTLKKAQLLSLVFIVESILLPFQTILLSRIIDSMGFSAHRKDKHSYFGPTMGASRYPIFDSIQEVAQVVALILFTVSISFVLITATLRCLTFIRKVIHSRVSLGVASIAMIVTTVAS